MDGAAISFIAIEAGLFVAGVFLGALSFRTIALPILYALPRAIWWAVRGRLHWRIVLRYFLSTILWCALFAISTYLLARFATNAWYRLFLTPLFFLGLCLGISVSALRAMGSKSGRRALHNDFLDFVKSHLKERKRSQEEKMGEDIYQPIWHLLRGGTRYGPLTYDELCRRAVRGELQENDLLWRPGVREWVEASSILGLVKNSKP
jgi:hypothetical protein